MRVRTIPLAGCLLALLSAPAFARGGDWEQVPAKPAPSAPQAASAGSLNGLLANTHSRRKEACALAGKFAAGAARLRDEGISQKAQLKTVDDPHGVLHLLAAQSRLSAGTVNTMGTTLHREVVYVYAHPKMTPQQVAAHWRQACIDPAAGGD